MSTSDRPASERPEPSASPKPNAEKPNADQTVDVRNLVYRSGTDLNPREIVENPAVTPEMVEQAPEDLRDDLMPKQKTDAE